jgi:glyoxylase-like metal-dependent hydrolase (beta-lactamase superfamily II)
MLNATGLTIHVHASGEGGIFANAYLAETERGVVAIDSTLKVSESRAFRARVDSLGKPLLGVLITHPHPDHVADIANPVTTPDVPIVTLPSVEQIMRAIEAPKRAQWGPVFKDEWIARWTFPNRLISDLEAVTFDGVTYRVKDMGAGGDSDANAMWMVDAVPRLAFVGDLAFNGPHSYMADGKILAWLANLGRASTLLADVPTFYPGHGSAGSTDMLARQREYLTAYCAAVKDLAEGRPTLTDTAKNELTARVTKLRPDAGLAFLIAQSADAVAAEMAGATVT